MEMLPFYEKIDRSHRSGSFPAMTALRSLGRKQIERLCSAMPRAPQTDRTLAALDLLSRTWADRPTDRPKFKRVIVGYGDRQPGDISSFCQAITGSNGLWPSRPLLTCLAFRENSDLPYTITLHVPIRCYAPNDQVGR